MLANDQDLDFISSERFNAVSKCITNLRFNTAAQCVLLVDITGRLINSVGMTGHLDVTNLISLLAGGFATTIEMSNYLQEKRAYNLNYHEGQLYDIYTANVGNKHFLALIFDHRVQTSKIGLVWLYTKRAMRELLEITAATENIEAGKVLDAEFSASLSDELDNLINLAKEPGSDSKLEGKDGD
jgi:hypothetical protein